RAARWPASCWLTAITRMARRTVSGATIRSKIDLLNDGLPASEWGVMTRTEWSRAVPTLAANEGKYPYACAWTTSAGLFTSSLSMEGAMHASQWAAPRRFETTVRVTRDR